VIQVNLSWCWMLQQSRSSSPIHPSCSVPKASPLSQPSSCASSILPPSQTHVLHDNFHLLRAVLDQNRQQIDRYRLVDFEPLCPLFHLIDVACPYEDFVPVQSVCVECYRSCRVECSRLSRSCWYSLFRGVEIW
jgi:hypothetical protein